MSTGQRELSLKHRCNVVDLRKLEPARQRFASADLVTGLALSISIQIQCAARPTSNNNSRSYSLVPGGHFTPLGSVRIVAIDTKEKRLLQDIDAGPKCKPCACSSSGRAPALRAGFAGSSPAICSPAPHLNATVPTWQAPLLGGSL